MILELNDDELAAATAGLMALIMQGSDGPTTEMQLLTPQIMETLGGRTEVTGDVTDSLLKKLVTASAEMRALTFQMYVEQNILVAMMRGTPSDAKFEGTYEEGRVLVHHPEKGLVIWLERVEGIWWRVAANPEVASFEHFTETTVATGMKESPDGEIVILHEEKVEPKKNH
jgi:hypothetical protein